MPEQILWSLDETAHQLRLSVRSVRRIIDRGELAVVRIGRCLRVPVSEVHAYLEVQMLPAHNNNRAGQAVLEGERICQRVNESGTRTVSTGGRTRRTGGQALSMDVDSQLAEVLALPTKPKPKRSVRGGNSKHTANGS